MCQGNINFFKVREFRLFCKLSGKFGIVGTYVNVRGLSGKDCHKPYSIQNCILC